MQQNIDKASETKRKRKSRNKKPKPTPFLNPEPLTRWIGAESVARINANDVDTTALLDTGARVNTVTPAFVEVHDIDVYPMSDLLQGSPHPQFTLNGLGGYRTVPDGYVVIRVRVPEISGFDEDQVALVVKDDSDFAARVPVILGTPAIGRIVNVIKESEMDRLSTPWAMVQVSGGLVKANAAAYPDPRIRVNRVEVDPKQVATTQDTDPFDFDEVGYVRKDVDLPPLATKAVKIKLKNQLRGCKAHVCVSPLEDDDKNSKLPPGVHIEDTYHVLNPCTDHLIALVRNDSGDYVTLKKGKPLASVALANEEPVTVLKRDMIDAIDMERGIPNVRVNTAQTQPKLSEEERKKKLMDTLDLSGLKKWNRKSIKKAKALLQEFQDIFSLEPLEIGETHLTEHEIKLTNSEPYKERFRRIPPPLIDEVRAHVKEMLDAGVIQPSKSPWSNAVVLVRKKDGRLRFCIDFRRLNSRTEPDSYALPRINEALDELRGMAHFSCLDLISGFWQIPMSAGSRPYTAFTVGNLGFFECLRMPFGLTNAPATFQRCMEEAMGDLNLKICMIYLDDLICYSKTEDEHLDRLRQIFERLRASGLKLKPEKCKFFQSEITYLGHRVSKEGIHPSAENIEAIKKMKVPTTYTEIRSFVNMVGAYRRFIRNFSIIAAPLYEHLRGENAKKKSESLTLSPEAVEAHRKLIDAVTTAPVLVPADFDKPFRLETDASHKGLGAVLSQKQDSDNKYHPISFGSACLKGSQRNYHSSKLEFFALFWAVTRQFKDYLYWSTFSVRTDNNPLTYINTTAKLDAVGHRWVSELANYRFSLEYVRGKENVVADCLSRNLPDDDDDDTQSKIDTQTADQASTPENSDLTALSEEEVKETLCVKDLGSDERLEVHDPFLVQLRMSIERDEEYLGQLAKTQLTPMHVVDWVAAQQEDPLIRGIHDWLKRGKKEKLSDSLGPELSRTPEGKECVRNHSRFRLHKGLVYFFTLPRIQQDNEHYIEALDARRAFFVPPEQRNNALRGCHDMMGHQGRDRTLSLLRERFWWPGMAAQMQEKLRKCERCRVHKAKASTEELHPIVATAPLDLVHVDYTTIETDMEPNKSPKVVNVLVIQDHFTKYLMVRVTPDQTAKTTARFLWEEFFSVFSPPRRLISDQGKTFTSKVVTELCNLLGIEKLTTTAYHPEGNGQVERANQTIFRMIGTLTKDEKADWPRHLASLTFAYNSTRSAITGYSPHYLMFGVIPRIPIDFQYPTLHMEEHRKHLFTKKVNVWIEEVRRRSREAITQAQKQTQLEADRQKRLFDKGKSCVVIYPGDTVLLLQKAFVGKRKVPDKWLEERYEVIERLGDSSPLYRVQDSNGRILTVHRNRMLLFEPRIPAGQPLTTYRLQISIFTVVPSWQTPSDWDGYPIRSMYAVSPFGPYSVPVQDSLLRKPAKWLCTHSKMVLALELTALIGLTATLLWLLPVNNDGFG